MTPPWRTADWAYLRFHGGCAMPSGCYGAAALDTWAARTRDAWGERALGYAYFNNDGNGCALRDAAVFAGALTASGVAVGKIPAVDTAGVVTPIRTALG